MYGKGMTFLSTSELTMFLALSYNLVHSSVSGRSISSCGCLRPFQSFSSWDNCKPLSRIGCVGKASESPSVNFSVRAASIGLPR
ncbi:hypothetical protein BDV41DRAFT_213156 [Aspergillus transmontanensis]|uniref:Uncharacterized protein n=1 Tax=Aspergillus transmontanensis TaxID=1034304 RepID=A0A5N6W499_9EURO|nr:hypothetical protein BDV41DRAFT_213156 [Aspergillus transmontanensis]